jgi:hypothetical protein
MWLIALTFALGLAVVVLTTVTVYLVRLERRRSDARVAALASAIDNPRWATGVEDEGREQEDGVISPSAMSLVVPDVERPSRAPAFAIAALVILAAGALLAVGMSGGSRASRHASAVSATSIELVSMRHAMDGETLIVSGLVRNPTATTTPALSAVVSVVGRDGRVIAHGESQLDPTVLGPGKETTFRVTVPQVGDPGRYRLAFVNGSQIVPHVDRRSDLSRTALANDARGN